MVNLHDVREQAAFLVPKQIDLLGMKDSRGFEVISSGDGIKAEGLGRVRDCYPELEGISNTSALLLRIHALMNKEIANQQLPMFMQRDMSNMLMIMDRPDIEEYADELEELLNAVIQQVRANGQIGCTELIYIMRQYIENFLAERTKTITHFAPKIVGNLRQYGTRSIDGGPEEVVYASHTNVVAGMGEMLAWGASMGKMWPLTGYYGLSTGLDDVYEKLCQRFDGLDKSKPLSLAFLQCLGTRVLHPMWDGNGRTFGAALGFQLWQSGHELNAETTRVLPQLPADVNDALLGRVLRNAQLGFVQNEQHLYMATIPSMRLDYMQKLRAEIEKAIEIGVDVGGPYYAYYAQAAEIIQFELK